MNDLYRQAAANPELFVSVHTPLEIARVIEYMAGIIRRQDVQIDSLLEFGQDGARRGKAVGGEDARLPKLVKDK